MTITVNLDPEELFVGLTGLTLVSDLGVALPTDIADVIPDESGTVDLDAGWVDLGYTTEEGPQFAFGRDINNIGAWQSFDALRSILTGKPSQVEFVLRQWNTETLRLGLGGTVNTPTATGVMIEPEDASFVDERQLIVYGVDGDKHYAFCFRRTQNTRELAFPFQRNDSSGLPIGMKLLGPPAGETKPFFILTDDPAIEADGS